MKRGWLWLSVLGLVILVVTVAVTFPAALAYRWWGERAPEVHLQGLSGTIWSGSARSAALRGQALGTLSWQISPWALVQGGLSARLQLAGSGIELKADVQTLADGGLRLSAVDAEAQASWLAPVLAIPALEPTGSLQVSGAELELDRARLPRSADAKLVWRDAGVRGQAVAHLGTITLVAAGSDGKIRIDAQDAGDGDLQVQGGASLEAGRYRSEIVLVARVNEGPIVQALEWIGAPRSEGGRLLIMEGRILVPEEKL